MTCIEVRPACSKIGYASTDVENGFVARYPEKVEYRDPRNCANKVINTHDCCHQRIDFIKRLTQ